MAEATQFSWICLVLFVNAVFQTHAAKLIEVQCNEPVATVVAVDPPLHRFTPYFVLLHRCLGSVDNFSPNVKVCRAIASKEITIRAHTSSWKPVNLVLRNHTRCGSECKGSPSQCDVRVEEWNEDKCECVCLFPERAPPEHTVPRKEGFRWNPHSCRYECNRSPDVCSAKKEWNSDECSCVCRKYFKHTCDRKNKNMDSETCGCKDRDHPLRGKRLGFFSHGIAWVLLVLLVVAVLVMILLLGMLLHRWKTTPRCMCMIQAGSQASDFTRSSEDAADTTGSESPSPQPQSLAVFETGV